MSCEKTIITNKKDNEFSTRLDKSEIITSGAFTKNVTTFLSVCIEGFANIFGIRMDSLITSTAEMVLKMAKRLNITSNPKVIASLEFLVIKKIEINGSAQDLSTVSFSAKKKFSAISDVSLIFGRQNILNELDSFTLSQLDVLTLGEMGFVEGVNFIVQKRTSADSSVQNNVELDMVMYNYTRLGTLDTDSLGTLDALTLEQLDRTIIT